MSESDPGSGDRSRSLVTNLRISRRTFIGTTGSLALALPVGAEGQLPAPKFEKLANGNIRLVRGAKTWEVDRCWFHSRASGSSGSAGNALSFQSSTQIRINGLFAGTNIVAQLRIRLRDDKGSWSLVWSFPGAEQVIDLDKWFSGTPLSNSVTFEVSDSHPSAALVLDAATRGTLRWPMRLALAAARGRDFGYSLGSDKRGRATGASLTPFDQNGVNDVSPGPTLSTAVEDLLPAGLVPKMRAKLSGVSISDPNKGWLLGVVGQGTELRLVPTLPQVTVEAVWLPDRNRFAYVWHVRSDGEKAHLDIGDRDRPRSMFLEGAAELIEIQGLKAETYAFIGDLTRVPTMLQGLRFAAMIGGTGDPKPVSGFRGTSDHLSLPIMLYTLHALGTDAARYDIDFRAYSAPGPYLDRSSILYSDDWFGDRQDALVGVDAILTLGRRGDDTFRTNRLHLGSDSGASVELHRPGATEMADDSPILRVRRHEDALDVGFFFQGYRIEVRNNGSKLVSTGTAQMGVRFHPQHIQEEVFEAPDPSPPGLIRTLWNGITSFVTPTQSCSTTTKLRALGSQETFAEANVYSKMARTRASASSRFVFKPRAAAHALELSVHALTDWSDLELSVSDRIEHAAQPLDDQIASRGITFKTTRADAQQAVISQYQPPKASETALELVTGLVFSPEARARFRVPRAPTAASGVWTAQLDLQPSNLSSSAVAVRAIWAAGLDPKRMVSSTQDKSPLAADAPFKTSLSGQDKGEIVLMSSGVGIAALRALTSTGQDVPASLVRLPKGDFTYLDSTPAANPKDPSGPKYRQEGVISPAPFARFAARLTGFGADLDAEWIGEPAANFDGDPRGSFINKAFTVERYMHRTSLGSDMLVKVLYKGFLFPYGFRVVLLKIPKREPQTVADLGAMAPMIQRFFIVPKPVTKSMPGLYQPFNGLEIPVRHARLRGERSPELDPDAMIAPPELKTLLPRDPSIPVPQCPGPNDDSAIVGSVFWPRLRGLKSEIEFEFDADDTGTRRTVPMLFVDNAAVHDAATMRAVVHYYNTIVDEGLRTENHHGGMTIFAAPKEAGDTSFETESIVLKARSRMVDPAPSSGTPTPETDPDLVQFRMDAFMEGADEPPFYPIMERASIKVPPLDRLLGSPQGLKTIGYNTNYVRNGFDQTGNKSELYLNFLDADGIMQLGGRGEISGGVAQTPTPISGISRSSAIVGGPARTAPRSSAVAKGIVAATATPQQQRESAMPPVGADDATPWDLSDVVSNVFNPAKYFKLPKVLGCVDLSLAVPPSLMDKQPKLKEVYDYSIGQANESAEDILKAFQAACQTAATAAWSALLAADNKLALFIAQETGTQPPAAQPANHVYPNLTRFYPGLTSGISGLADELVAASNTSDIASLPKEAKALMDSWRQLRGAVDAVIANPSPEPVRNIITELRSKIDAVETALGSGLAQAISKQLADFLQRLVSPIRDAILDQVCDTTGQIVDSSLFEAFFGTVPVGTAPTRAGLADLIDKIVNDTGYVPVTLPTAPLAYAFTLPLLSLLGSVRRLISNSEAVAIDLIGQLAEAAVGALATVVKAVANFQSLLDAAAAAVDPACKIAVGPLMQMLQLADVALPTTPQIKAALATFDDKAKALNLPDLGSSSEADAVRQAAAALRVPVYRLADLVRPIDDLRGTFPTADVDRLRWCQAVGRVPSTIAALFRLRDEAIKAIEDCAVQYVRVSEALQRLAAADAADAMKALEDVRDLLVGFAYNATLAALADGVDAQSSTLANRLKVLGATAFSRLDAVQRSAFLEAQALHDLAKNGAAADRLTIVAAQAAKVAGLERELLAYATDFTSLPASLQGAMKALIGGLMTTVGKPIVTLHETVRDCAQGAIDAVNAAPDIIALLTGPTIGKLIKVHAAVVKDLADLQAVAGDPAKAAALVTRWQTEEPGLSYAVRTVLDLFEAIAHGQVGAMFDLAFARQAIEDALKHLIPSKVTLHYDWDTVLDPFPAGNPVFIPNTTSADPQPDKDSPALSISTTIVVDVLDPQHGRSVNVIGKLTPFALDLLGANHLVKIYFEDTEFTYDGSGSPNFHTKIKDVKIGQELMFLQELQQWMSKASGLIVKPSFQPPGVEIGYAIGTDLIDLGAVKFLNVGFSVSALLTFDTSPARFRFAFADSEKPFGVIVAPYYYGGGFVALTASATSALIFEIQLEFGAAAAIKFGPLHGQGQVSTGIYLRTDPKGLLLKGFVHALGEGQVGCFGISVNLEVAVRSEDSKMIGSSKYSFTFKVGFLRFEFHFDAEYSFSGGGAAQAAAFIGPADGPASYILGYCDKLPHWLDYRDHFVEDWPTA